MAFTTDEILTVTSGDVFTPDTDLIDNSGGARATIARISNSEIANSSVLYRFNTDPNVSTEEGHLLIPGASVDVRGYENIKNLRFALLGSTTAKLFISYGT